MHNAPFFIKYKLHQLVFWMLIFGVWYFLRYQDYSTEAKAFQVTLIKVIDLFLMISITNYILIPRLLYQKKYGWFVLAFVIVVLTSSILKMNILGRLLNSPQLYSLSGNLKARIYDNIIPHFFLVIAGAAIKLMMDYGELQQRMAVTAKEKAEAELNFLKSQINPHFLFNSLNSVYFLIEKNNTAARNALHKFSEMLRYQLYEMNDDKIPIEKEINYLHDYVDLQKLRNESNYNVSFICPPAVSGFFIEPLLLIPFVENTFKHISHFKDQPNFIRIELDRIDGQMYFEAENSTEPPGHTGDHQGIGLNNVKRRLALLYPGRHWLEITGTEHCFKVTLRIKI